MDIGCMVKSGNKVFFDFQKFHKIWGLRKKEASTFYNRILSNQISWFNLLIGKWQKIEEVHRQHNLFLR